MEAGYEFLKSKMKDKPVEDAEKEETKKLKVYMNGSNDHEVITVSQEQLEDWPNLTNRLSRLDCGGTSSSVDKVYDTQGNEIDEVEKILNVGEVVVCSEGEKFKEFDYGEPDKSTKDEVGCTRRLNGAKLRKGREKMFVQSAIFDDSYGNESQENIPKTMSERNVMSKSQGDNYNVCLRASHSPRPRPVSTLVVSDRKSPYISRIPKRIVTTKDTNDANNVHVSKNNNNKPCTKKETSSQERNKVTAAQKQFVRPRLVTVIRSGMKPRKAVRILLNKKTARSFDQVLDDITGSIKPDWGAVRKVYEFSTRKQVSNLEDFFGKEDIFLACPNDRIGKEDFELDSEECKAIQPFVKMSLSHKCSKPRGIESSRSPQRRPKSSNGSSGVPINSSKSNSTQSSWFGNFPPSILERFEIGDIIGTGNYAVVRHCTNRRNRQQFALKIIDKTKADERDAPIDLEVKLLSELRHPNIVAVYQKICFTNELYLVMELMQEGDLFDKLSEVISFSEEDSSCMAKDVASALSYLHSYSIVHRDIKPENLLFGYDANGRPRIKVADFGLAQIVKGPLYTICGTPAYVAPEILTETGYDTKVDIWALGVIIYVLLCGYPPFASSTGDQNDLFNAILSADFYFPCDPWSNVSDDAKKLIQRMIEPSPEIRMTADECLEHPWFCADEEEKKKKREKLKAKGGIEFSVYKAMGLDIDT